MDLVWAVIGGILMLAGIIGCLLPFIPGPPLSFLGLLLLQLRETAPFTTQFLILWAVIVIVITALDYLVPIYGTKRFGGTKYGLWGCTIGLIAGFWFGPVGIIAGPFLGALLGEWLGNRNSDQAFKAAIGSFVGFLVGTVLKLIASGVMTYYFIASLI
ncbi:MAG TPA: DUF456 domain-containing protein [Cyclobacteriaceae bacterium]|nr:DUF456 domain-containing protein [Cyclobacteriaceae bacterium]HNP06835.1 DUF456 domain-containing protein [Cyclobacteriaceae bacterium]HRK54828.1 DUF456 domain-containing protein [Cyclobacteriaceae bacterium]